jgi:hypothetical protein
MEQVMTSQFSNQISNADAQCIRDPQQRMKADPLLASLDFANVNGMQVGYFGQFLLAQTRLFTMLANRFPKNLKLLSRKRHSL